MSQNSAARWPQSLNVFFQTVWRDSSIRDSLIIFLVLRLLTGIAVIIMVNNVPITTPEAYAASALAQAIPANAPLANLVKPWYTWDTSWYVQIALQGYEPQGKNIAFPPLYPILIRLLAPVVGNNYVLASLIISNMACLIAFILLFKLIERQFNDSQLARHTLIALAAFPTAFFLVAGYTETLFLTLVLGAFLLSFRGHWVWAGVLAYFAALTRLQGAALALPLGWIAYVGLGKSGIRAKLARLPVLIGAPAGAVSYLVYLSVNNLGSVTEIMAEKWGIGTALPHMTFVRFFQRLIAGQLIALEYMNMAALLLALLFAVVVTIRFRPVYSVYVWSTLFVILLRYRGVTQTQLASVARYILLLFPCFIAAAKLLRYRWAMLLYAAVGVVLQLVLLYSFIYYIFVG